MKSVQDKLCKQADDPPPIVGKKRASEIAAMEELTIDEFRELTGEGIGIYGIYHISESGITVGNSVNMSELTAMAQHNLSGARKALTLRFPCSTDQFAQWYEATCGALRTDANGVVKRAPSDFPLAAGFLDEVRRLHMPNQRDLSRAVTSKQIIEAFPVKNDGAENSKWWDTRLRDPENYGLLECRAMQGKPGRGNPSLWYPMSVAAWLLDKKHLRTDAVFTAVNTHFPGEDAEYLREP